MSRSFVDSIGGAIAVFALLGLMHYRSRHKEFNIAVFLMLFLVFAIFGNSLMTRYLIMFIPIFSILAAEVLISILRNRNPRISTIGVVLILAVVLHALVYSIAGVITRLDETRTKAAHFIEEKIPEGSTIGIGYVSSQFGWRIHKWRQPYIRIKNYREVDFTNDPEYVVLSSYDIDEITKALNSGLMTENYLWPDELDNWWYLNSSPSPTVFKTYISLLQEDGYCLLESFRSRILAPIEFPPPDILIYKKSLSEDKVECQG
jgi:4-amino-4-deoxy-L-arabinose transferase-like glycosyltransferase